VIRSMAAMSITNAVPQVRRPIADIWLERIASAPALVAEFSEIPLIAGEENHTLLDLTNDKMRMRNVTLGAAAGL